MNGFITPDGGNQSCPFASCAMNAIAVNGIAYFNVSIVFPILDLMLSIIFSSFDCMAAVSYAGSIVLWSCIEN